jgi:hypothetical protein
MSPKGLSRLRLTQVACGAVPCSAAGGASGRRHAQHRGAPFPELFSILTSATHHFLTPRRPWGRLVMVSNEGAWSNLHRGMSLVSSNKSLQRKLPRHHV